MQKYEINIEYRTIYHNFNTLNNSGGKREILDLTIVNV